MAKQLIQFANDSVVDYTPVSFAGSFVRKMRRTKGLAAIPSVRTAIAIPKFLTARYWRQERLDPMDYLHAAVYNTPYEDQEIAYRIAYQMLFPKQIKSKPSSSEDKKAKRPATESLTSGIDQIFSELASAGFDDLLEAMDEETNLDDLMAEQQSAWKFLEELLQSTDPSDQARLDLLEEMESEYAIVQRSLNDRNLVDTYISQLLAKLAGSWSSLVFQPAVQLDMGKQLLRQSQMPWEQASAMTVMQHQDSKKFVEDMLSTEDAHTLGTTLRYLQDIGQPPDTKWQDKAFDRIKTMSDYYEMLRGMQTYRDPSKEMLLQTVSTNMRQGLDLAEQIDTDFGSKVQSQLFKHFLTKSQTQVFSLKQVQGATYDDGEESWEKLLQRATERELRETATQPEITELALTVGTHQSPRLTSSMKGEQDRLAEEISTVSMEQITEKTRFLPELDHLMTHQIIPDLKRVIEAGKKLGIVEELITERYGAPLQLLQSYIDDQVDRKDKYDRVVRKLSKSLNFYGSSRPAIRRYQVERSIPPEIMNHMMQQALADDNSFALASLGAVDLGLAMRTAAIMQHGSGASAQQKVADALDKGIGGGTNLLQQWFLHRHQLPTHLKNQLRDMMREVLLEVGMDWANRGTGSSEEGLIPISNTRPYRPGDEFDLIDIDATLDTVMMSGKTLNQITEDELMVTETSKGKTALGVLIDISGSMSGRGLAMCAIAVVMLLGKLEAKEVAIALFESDTHRIKGFEDEIELNLVANELLNLQARGGTRADAALRWIAEEFERVPAAEVKILYFLSDFYLTEQNQQLTLLCDTMASMGVKLLAGYHSNHDEARMTHMVELLNGDAMRIKNFESLPHILAESFDNLH